MSHFECDTLFEASKALLKKSGLARWGDQAFVFVAMYPGDDDSEFEKYWKKEFHSKFGRYMAWVLFSVGAENLAKAACVCYEITTGPDYGTLGRYTKSGGLLDQLCEKPSNSDCDKTRLTQGYKSLKRARNRDVHGYVANKRREDFPAVEPIFVPAFNILVEAMRRNHHFDH